MSFSKELSILVAVLLLAERSISLALLYFVGVKLFPASLSDEFKRIILQHPIFANYPILKSFAIKIFNPKYSQIQESSGVPFFCQCGDNHEEPGVRPTPSDQGCSETCTVHAAAKSIVSLLDKKNIDVDQETVANGLIECIGTTRRQWPSVFDGKVIQIQGSQANEEETSLDMKIKLHVDEVVSTNRIPNERCEYILCTTYLSKNDRHSLYIEKKDDSTGILSCINSWGQSYQPRPVISIGHPSNMFFKIEIDIDPRECENCKEARKLCKAYADVIDNKFFQQNNDKKMTKHSHIMQSVSCACNSMFEPLFSSMRGPKNEKRSVSASLEKLEENKIERDLKKTTEHVKTEDIADLPDIQPEVPKIRKNTM